MTVQGGFCLGDFPDRDPLDRDHPGQRPPLDKVPPPLWTETRLDRDPLYRDPLDREPPWTEIPLSCDLWCMRGQRPPPLWTEWHTSIKTLPCPKLRLRAVKMFKWPFTFLSERIYPQMCLVGQPLRWWKYSVWIMLLFGHQTFFASDRIYLLFLRNEIHRKKKVYQISKEFKHKYR